MSGRLCLVAAALMLYCDSAEAQTSVPCIRLPFQAAAHGDVPSPTNQNGTVHTTVAITFPASFVEVEQVTIRIQNPSTSGFSLRAIQVNSTLYGQTVGHGVELNAHTGAQPMVTANGPTWPADVSRSIRLYADPSSQLRFELDLQFGGLTDSGTVDVTAVGRLVSAACWIGSATAQ